MLLAEGGRWAAAAAAASPRQAARGLHACHTAAGRRHHGQHRQTCKKYELNFIFKNVVISMFIILYILERENNMNHYNFYNFLLENFKAQNIINQCNNLCNWNN